MVTEVAYIISPTIIHCRGCRISATKKLYLAGRAKNHRFIGEYFFIEYRNICTSLEIYLQNKFFIFCTIKVIEAIKRRILHIVYQNNCISRNDFKLSKFCMNN